MSLRTGVANFSCNPTVTGLPELAGRGEWQRVMLCRERCVSKYRLLQSDSVRSITPHASGATLIPVIAGRANVLSLRGFSPGRGKRPAISCCVSSWAAA